MSPAVEDEIRELLQRSGGSERLDIEFKSILELRTASHKAEFAKDVALQANLPTGGNLLYGFDDSGKPLGLPTTASRDDAARVLVNRLMFAPLKIEIRPAKIESAAGARVDVVWVQVGANPYAIPTAFLDADGTWKIPVRVDTVTKYLSGVEALAYFRSREPETTELGSRFLPVSFNAEPDSVPETLDSNLFPFVHIPTVLWAGRTKAETEEEVYTWCGTIVPPFRLWNHQVLCLREYNLCETAFSRVLTQSGRVFPTQDFLQQRDARRVMIGLLNKEIVSYAHSIPIVPVVESGADSQSNQPTPSVQRLLFDEDGGKVYFPPFAGRPWKFRWQSFQRTGTRTVVGVRKRPDGSVRHWFHFAARFRIEDLGRAFALLIEPTWHFTKDGVVPLPSYRVGRVATRKMGLEDNARILYNIHFWAQLFAQGAPRITLRLGGGDAVVSKDSFKISLKGGIAGDLVRVPDMAVDLDAEIDEIVPVEAEPEEGDQESGDWSFGT